MAADRSDCSEMPLCLRLFGSFDATVAGKPLPPLRSRKHRELLALLTLRHGRNVERSWVAGILWLDTPTDLALSRLRAAVADIRRVLGSEAAHLSLLQVDAVSGSLRRLCGRSRL